MAQSRSSANFFRAVIFLATVWTVATCIFLIDNNLFSKREQFQESDYIMTFYVAGHLAANGRARELYPLPNAHSFIDTPFDRAAHELLPHLPKSSTGAYMYIPLVAGFFAPFSFVDPNLSLFFWQVLSIAALALCACLLAPISGVKASELFFLSFLYGPVFLTLWAGQLGLGFGLAPLCLGYFLLLRQWPLAAGLVWSLLLLKPQYFLVAAFVALTCALMKRYRTLAGLFLGVAGLVALTISLFSFSVTSQWLQSHRVSDAYFFSGLQGIPSHLVTGLPANLLILFPLDERGALKLPLYGGAAALWLFGLWFCSRYVVRRSAESAQISVAFVVGMVLTSVTLPHLLYYDLCVLLPAGVLLMANDGPLPQQPGLRIIGVTGWIVVSAFLPLLIGFANQKLFPLILELILLTLFVGLLIRLNRGLKSAPSC